MVVSAVLDGATSIGVKSYADQFTPPDGYVFSFEDATNTYTPRPDVDAFNPAGAVISMLIPADLLADISAGVVVTEIWVEADGIPLDRCEP